MYSTCTFCHAPLGANDILERFPVGRRLAFDGKRGRLWVVCRVCKQWNLSPIETRWEAIEDAERAYGGTRLRAATGEIGLARLGDGTELIRIGEPLRPEFAAWRYGERFASRWRFKGRAAAVGASALALTKGAKGILLMNATSLPIAALLSAIGVSELVRRFKTSARWTLESGVNIWLSQAHVQTMKVQRDPDAPGRWNLQFQYSPSSRSVLMFRKYDPLLVLRGTQAEEAARRLLPRLNRGGGPRQTVGEAVDIIQRHGNTDSLMRFVTQYDQDLARPDHTDAFPESGTEAPIPPMLKAPPALRLAAEMAVHEELERRALEGELELLKSSWREAEEVAAIADDLVISPTVLRALESLRLR